GAGRERLCQDDARFVGAEIELLFQLTSGFEDVTPGCIFALSNLDDTRLQQTSQPLVGCQVFECDLGVGLSLLPPFTIACVCSFHVVTSRSSDVTRCDPNPLGSQTRHRVPGRSATTR